MINRFNYIVLMRKDWYKQKLVPNPNAKFPATTPFKKIIIKRCWRKDFTITNLWSGDTSHGISYWNLLNLMRNPCILLS